MIRTKEISQTLELLSFLTAKRKLQLVLMLLIMILGSLAEVASIGLVIPFLGALTSPEIIFNNHLLLPIIQFLKINSPVQLLLPFTAMFICAVIFSAIIRLLLLYSTIRFSNAVGHDLGVDVYRKTLFQNYSVQANQNSSEIINGIILKVNTITGGVIKPLLNILSSLVLMIGIIIALLIIDISTSLTALIGFGLIYFLVIKITHRKIRRNSEIIAQYSTKLIKSLQEGLGGIRDILIDGTQNFFSNIYKKSDSLLRKATGDNTFIAASPRYLLEALGMVLIATLAYSLRTYSTNFNLVIPTLGALALGAQRLLPTMQLLYDSYTNLKGAQASLNDVLILLRQRLPVYAQNQSKEKFNFKNNIELKNVNFKYSDESPLVLENININIKKGSRVGFVGETGSGKSTLLDIFMGLIHPTSGKLLVDDKSIGEDNQYAWWKNIAHVPQSIFLSDNTIEQNIAFGINKIDIDSDKIIHSAALAQIHEFIIDMPNGYNTIVGERGVRLSGGQRQRIGIARALYKGADVLMFDEATSSLDNSTENNVMEAIETLNRDLTVFIIAHRLTTLKSCDVIYEIVKGKIARSLSYEQLLNNTKSLNLKK